MAETSKKLLKENFIVEYKYEAFFPGGKVQYSENGDQMYCSCGNNVKVLDIESGTVVQTICNDENDEITSFIVAPDQSVLITSSRVGLLKQWDLSTNKCSRVWKSIHKGPIPCMTFDVTSTLLATGGSDSTVKVWDIIRQYCTHNLKGAQGVFSTIRFHPDIKRLLLFGSANDNVLRVWDLKTSRCSAALEGHYSTITSLQFTPDGNTLLSAGRDKVVIIWDIVEFRIIKTIPVFESIESIILLPDKKFPCLNVVSKDLHFVTAGDKGLIRIWKASSGEMVYSSPEPIVTMPAGESKLTLALTQANLITKQNVIALVTYECNIIFYNLDDLTLKKQMIGYNDDILDIQFMGPADEYIAVATNSINAKIFELSTFTCILMKGHTDIILGLSTFAKDPWMLASSSKDHTVRLWNLDPKTNVVNCIAIASGHTLPVGAIATSLLGANFIVSAGQDMTLKVWRIPDKNSFNNETDMVMLKTRFTEIAHEKDINSVAVSPNDKVIASGSQDKLAKLWNAETGKLLGVFRGHRRGIWCIGFSPVDQVLATCSADTTIKIWNIIDFSCVKTFEGHGSSVLKFQFISKGLQLISSGSDGLLKLWTIKTNECIKTFDEHSDRIWALALTKDEEKIVTGGADSTLIIWKDITKEEKQDEWLKKGAIILQEQKLLNLLQRKKYRKALSLAITLNQPFRALNIIKELLKEDPEKLKLQEAVEKLSDDQVEILMKFATTWNTNSKNCYEAQCILNIILKSYTPDELLKFPNIKEIVEGLIPYTERHISRIDLLVQQAMILDYTWQCMKLSNQAQ